METRYHDVYTEHLREALKSKVTPEEFSAAVVYARSKAGGYASAEAKAKAKEAEASSVLAGIINATPESVKNLSDADLLQAQSLLNP